jgi:hypothetical protein
MQRNPFGSCAPAQSQLTRESCDGSARGAGDLANLGDPTSLEIFSIEGDGTLEHLGSELTDYTPFYVGIFQY